MKKKQKQALKHKWYEKLIEDLKKLTFEGIVKTKHAIGKRIVEDELKFRKPEYGSKRVETLAKDINVSTADIYNCIKFVKKFPEISNVLENLPWRTIVKEELWEEKSKPEIPPLPPGTFSVMYADPPWQYDFSETESRKIEKEYPTLTAKEIEDYPDPTGRKIKDLPKDNTVLFLWATAPKLREALSVMESWGFEYKTHAIWDKEIIGMGYWFRGQHELLLVGVKGKVSPPEESLRISSIIAEKRTRHSKKPFLFRNLIRKWFPNQTYIEMFGRPTGHPSEEGWEFWGNEVK